MSLLHVAPGNSNQEEQDARTANDVATTEDFDILGFPKDFREFQEMCDEIDSEWTVVENKKRSSTFKERVDEKIRSLELSQQCSDLDGLFECLSLDEYATSKESDRERFHKHCGGRKNRREERRREMRARLRKRNSRMAARKVKLDSVEPHSSPNEDEPNTSSNDFVEERNKMTRIATDTQGVPSNFELPDLLRSVSTFSQTQNFGEYSSHIEDWVSHLENIVILGYDMSKANSFTDIFMATVSYAKKYCNGKSIVMELYQIIDEVTTTCKEDPSQVDPHSWRDITGQDVIDKWELFKTNTIFKKISYLISAVMSLTVCTTKKIEWNVFGLQLVAVEAAKEQLMAVDVIDALIRTFVWMCDVGWRCMETQSLMPLLYSDARVQEYNENCDFVLAHSDAACAGNIDDLGAYEKKLDEVLMRTCKMKAVKNDGATALWLQKRYSELVAIKERLAAKRKNTDIRMAPLGFSLHGATSVGKTTLGKLTMNQSLAAMKYTNDDGVVDDDRILTLDMFDKYQSTYTSDILGVFMDDIGNAKPDFQKDSPHTSVIIKFFNNVAAQAIKAELNAKGVVFIDFKVGIVTTNKKDLDAHAYSNCPESILRRFYHVNVEVKEKYREAGSTMLNSAHPDLQAADTLAHDVWDLTIEKVHTFKNGSKEAYRFDVMEVDMPDGRKVRCEKLGLQDYLDVVIALSKKHKTIQDRLLEKSKRSAKAKYCDICSRLPQFCDCVEKEVVPHSLNIVSTIVQSAATHSLNRFYKKWTKPLTVAQWVVGFSPVRIMLTSSLEKVLDRELNRISPPVMVAFTPQWIFDTLVFQKLFSVWCESSAVYDIQRPLLIFTLFCTGLLGYGIVMHQHGHVAASIVLLWLGSVCGYFCQRMRVEHVKRAYLSKRDALSVHAKQLRDGYFPKGVLFAASLVVGVKLMSMWNNHRLKTNPQGFSPEEIDAQPGWFGFMMKQINWKSHSTVVGATPEHVQRTGLKNLGWANFTRSDGSKTACNIVYPQKGIVWYPLHVFYPSSDMTKQPADYVDVVVFRGKSRETSQFKFKAQLGHNSVFLDGLDMVATFVERCPDLKTNIEKFLPLKQTTGTSVCTMIVRDKEANVSHERVVVTHGDFGHKYLTMKGGCYSTTKAVTGSCMSMLITEEKNPIIAGFHIGGNSGKNYGVMMMVTQEQARSLREKLYSLPGIRGLANSTELPSTQYGIKILDSSEVHPNAKFFHEMPENVAIDVLGSTKLRTEMKSRVVPSILEKEARRLFDIKKHWGPPRLKPNWKAFNATLEYIIDPSDMFVPSELQRARKDWVNPIIAFAKDLNKKDSVRPLTDREMIMGVPGKRFLDAMPMNTSMGAPLFGPKSKYFFEVREGEMLIDRIPSPEVKVEMERCLACWERGERAYPVTCATLKDEATDVEKEKVRVFQAVAVAFGMYIRKWFLPIARVLSLCPELSESAVGINSFSKQWDDLMSHAEKFADDDRVVAWDYSKFDIRMNAQITYAALMCFIDIAEVCDYSEHDIKMMTSMVADIIHPLIDYNGTMIMAYNMNTSGNNITVNINGAANALYTRLGFFDACPEVENFRDAVALTTYGDDAKGSVAKQYRDRFNFKTYKAFLAKHGIKITEPDKSDHEGSDLHVDDADFLKRHSQYIPEIGCRIGKLSKESMYKPLCSNLQSKTETPQTVAISCVETYMHELFAHGREEYEKDQPKMVELCQNALHFVPPAVQYSFDSRVEMWHEKYS